MKYLIPVVKKKYGLEEILGLSLNFYDSAGDVNSILQLNRGDVAILCRRDLQSRKVLMC
jgi:hypothetical protein